MVCPGLNIILKGNAGLPPDSDNGRGEIINVTPADAKAILDALRADAIKTYADTNQFYDEDILSLYEDAIN
jgi:hypothetical protein